MALKHNAQELFKGFSKLNRSERLKRLKSMGALNDQDYKTLQDNVELPAELAEDLIENVIGYFHLPMGVACNMRIDDKYYAVPMAVEETSIIAALSKTARWIQEHGSIETETVGDTGIGQIQIAKLNSVDKFTAIIEKNKDYLIDLANNDVAQGLVRRGGGVTDVKIRLIHRDDGATMGVLHIHVNTCDAMGANIINQICEFLKPHIEHLTNETVTMCILSNLVDSKLTRATVTLKNIPEEIGKGIEEASIFAELDPYRATTNNKGVLNGIDPILIATGNDWRAVEAGIHAYAARDGQYRSVTKWRYHEGTLTGIFEAPIILGIVGGVTKLHPTAQLALRMLDIEHAEDLSRIIAAVGLVQNLGAIKALSTVGIIQGHMKLHITNLSLSAGANDREQPILQKRLQDVLRLTNRVTLSNALELLKELRTELASSKKHDEHAV